MRKGRGVNLLLMVVMVALLVGAASQIEVISTLRSDLELETADLQSGAELASELRIPTAALTIFRSLAIDYLCIRAEELKNDGQYFDAHHLARLICSLQPNLPSVWKFNGWNMAYNISAGLRTWPERWNWVRAGIELIRDEGLKHNKRSLALYREVAWYFQNKIGNIMDEAHVYYKWRLAYEMTQLVGAGTNEEIFALATSPRRWDAVSCPPLQESDFVEAGDFLVTLRDSEDVVSKYIHETMRPSVREQLGQYDREGGEPGVKLLLDVINELNQLLLDEEFYDKERFTDVTFDDELKAMTDGHLLYGDVVRLNRLLLTAAYLNHIAPVATYRLDEDEEVATLMAELRKADDSFDSDEALLDSLVESLTQPWSVSNALQQVMEGQWESQAFRRLSLYLRARGLREQWRLEPIWMIVINRLYGPVDYDQADRKLSLDWRLPFVQSLYWTIRGLEYVEDEAHLEVLGLRRLVYHNLQDLFHRGQLRLFTRALPRGAAERLTGQEILDKIYPSELSIYLGVDLRMFPVAYQAALDMIKTRRDRGETRDAGTADAAKILCRWGITNLYLAGYKETARQYLGHLQEWEPNNKDYQVTLETFVAQKMKEELSTIGTKHTRNYINGFLRRSIELTALSDDENASLELAHAEQIYRIYTEEFNTEPGDRLALPPFREMRWQGLLDFLKDGRIGVQAKGLLLTRFKLEQPELYDKLMAEISAEQGSNDGS